MRQVLIILVVVILLPAAVALWLDGGQFYTKAWELARLFLVQETAQRDGELSQKLAEVRATLAVVEQTATAVVVERQLNEALATLAVMEGTATAIAARMVTTPPAVSIFPAASPTPPSAAVYAEPPAEGVPVVPLAAPPQPAASATPQPAIPTPRATASLPPTTPSIVQVRPAAIWASSEPPCSVDSQKNPVCYPAGNAIDGDETTAWRESAALTPWLEIDLPQPTVVRQLAILGGYTKTDPLDGSDRWAENRRPRRIQVYLNGVEAGIYSLQDRRDWQIIDLAPQATRSARRIRLVVLDSYPPLKGSRPYVAISELQVLGYLP